MIPGRVAFLDVETTGADPRTDRITEIGMVLLDDGVVVEEWAALVNPGRGIPPGIELLTGISDAMVSGAPAFADIALDLAARLDGRLLAAHNARFDYAFLRNEFRRAGMTFRGPVLCTVRLSRHLFPEHPRHNLDVLIERFALPCDARHRALPDARLVYHFACEAGRRLGLEALRAAVATVRDAPRAPEGMNADLIDDAPDTPGMYLLYDAQGAALFAGKAANVRTQLLAHFCARGRHAQEQRQALQAGAVEWFSTAGELGAALRHLRALETLAPRHNRPARQRREAWALHWRPEAANEPVRVRDLEEAADDAAWRTLYGPFRSRADALAALRGLAREHRLCATVLGLESQAPCSAHAAGACNGACIGREKRAAHNLRLMQALLRLRMRAWPYTGAVVIVEQDPARTRRELHLVNAWRYLGSAQTDAELHELMRASHSFPTGEEEPGMRANGPFPAAAEGPEVRPKPALPPFEMDVYRLLTRALDDNRRFQVVDLSAIRAS
jgi:DNA polymerase-3 subunit epsilon